MAAGVKSAAVQLGPLSELNPIVGKPEPSFPVNYSLFSQTEAFFRFSAEPVRVRSAHGVILPNGFAAVATETGADPCWQPTAVERTAIHEPH